MAVLDERSWAEAIGMYAHRYTIAKVTGRKHQDWALDVCTLMRGETPDARGWRTVDFHEGDVERLDDPFYPFVSLPSASSTTEAWRARVGEIPRSSARRFLVALSTPWLNVERERDFVRHRPALEEKADVILSRFPEGSRFYANTGPDSKDIDYYQRVSGCSTVSRHDWDLGLVLVSDSEVGMVWSFDPK
ncbi:hypothetical protein ACIRFH_05845 [Streptomyces sp. NPDC093586]|uniref:hypothetical protein n=1 Tax=Streptomyces sp. NPDC093586 TaxID=3366042 RepID=UPI00382795A9